MSTIYTLTLTAAISDHGFCKTIYEFLIFMQNLYIYRIVFFRISISKADEAIWKNLHGMDRVVSKPDIHLYKHGITTTPEVRTSDMVVSVKVRFTNFTINCSFLQQYFFSVLYI